MSQFDAIMTSRIPPFGFFDPETLAVLERSFDATWPVLEAHEPFLDSETRGELRRGLSQTLVALVGEGVIDADQPRLGAFAANTTRSPETAAKLSAATAPSG